MKRKLDEDNVPTPVDPSKKAHTEPSFESMGLDARLLQAIFNEGFNSPTSVQSKVIPLALEGKDLFVRAKTGSGKTAAYLLPILESILRLKATSKVITAFTAFCHKDVRTVDLTQKVPESVQRSLLASCPDIVIATPARAALHIHTSAFSVDSLSIIAIDEADLVLSYGYEEDLQTVAKSISKGVQMMLMSATLTTDIDTLKSLYCRDPVRVELDEKENNGDALSQYVVKCAEDEKFLLSFVIFKFKLIKGKCIVFVADINRCYRLKLFLEQFGVKACILNSELPVKSRCHVVEEFNKNVYDIIIASDEYEVLGDEGRAVAFEKKPSQKLENLAEKSVEEPGEAVDANQPGALQHPPITPRRKLRSTSRQKDYGISRGIDFKNVACVFNFDLPTSSKSYTHRLGRTARAGRTGMALSFVVPSTQFLKHKPTSTPSVQHDEVVLEKVVRYQGKKGNDVRPYEFDMKQVDAFRYRVNDALRAVTQIAIREARTRELRQELLKSEKLKRHFEENPEDLQHLRHDGELRAARLQPHLKHIPDYLMPNNGKRGSANADIGFVGFRKESENRIRKARMNKRMSGKGKKPANRKLDPLKTFNAKGRR
ncbi:MAG: hypothetical protein Q9166_004240 [cf. Caloplaca sp. 2 TL-2023]